jgi:hypothetical protein
MEQNKTESHEESNYWSTERVNELLRKADEEGLDFKSVDNPFHDNNPEFKRANILFEYTREELIEIKKCAEDVTYFSKHCQVMTDTGLNYINLRDYQTSVLKEYQDNRFNIFLAPRQVGKCLLPTSTVRDKNNKKVSINSLIFKKNIYFYIKNILYRIYLKL